MSVYICVCISCCCCCCCVVVLNKIICDKECPFCKNLNKIHSNLYKYGLCINSTQNAVYAEIFVILETKDLLREEKRIFDRDEHSNSRTDDEKKTTTKCSNTQFVHNKKTQHEQKVEQISHRAVQVDRHKIDGDTCNTCYMGSFVVLNNAVFQPPPIEDRTMAIAK